jgi:DNA polymerase I-like protein with 3'-5' exonuclease and polymerase domains|nr:MAG TPA: DNA POLYMERASE [Caudoviricetes sp.]
MKKRGGKISDSRLLSQAKPKPASTITYVTGDKFKDIVLQAKSLSKTILSKILPRLELVTDENRLREYIDKCLKNGIAAIDTETSGLLPYKDIIAGVCLYTPGEKGIYVPMNHISQLTHNRMKNQIDKKVMRFQLNRLVRKKIKWIAHNSKFDWNVVYWQVGVRLNPVYWDTLVAGNLLNENEPHSLKILHAKYVQPDEDKRVAKFNELFKGVQFPLIPPDVAYMYAANDPIMTYELYEFQKPFLTADDPQCIELGLQDVAWCFHNIEIPILDVLFDMETYGVRLDKDLMIKFKEEFQAKVDEAEIKFKELLKEYQNELEDLRTYDFKAYQKLELDERGNVTVSISSSTQLAILFYDIMGLKSNDDRKPRGTGSDILQSFNLPLAEAVLEYRSYAKLVSTYMNMDEFEANGDGRVHTNYNSQGARTGRMSSDKPNLQNIPARGAGKKIRQIFAASEGMYIIGSDYSQQEPRTLAALSGDEEMINAYIQGKDLYAVIASTLYGVPYEECLEFHVDENGNKLKDEHGVEIVNHEGKTRRQNTKSVLLGQHKGSFPLDVAKRCA